LVWITHGHTIEEKHSIKAMQWIKYLSTTKGVHIQHARNGGEKEIGHYKVDGFSGLIDIWIQGGYIDV
jgi:hypothetical protein